MLHCTGSVDESSRSQHLTQWIVPIPVLFITPIINIRTHHKYAVFAVLARNLLISEHDLNEAERERQRQIKRKRGGNVVFFFKQNREDDEIDHVLKSVFIVMYTITIQPVLPHREQLPLPEQTARDTHCPRTI